MLGKAHMMIGAALGTAVVGLLPQDPYALWAIPIAFIAAGLPDMFDSEHAAARGTLGISWSSIKRDAKRFDLVTLTVIPRALAALGTDMIASILPHRGVTHWGITWLLLSIIVFQIALILGWGIALPLAFSVGWLSHDLADMPTESGLAFWGPFSKRKVHLLPRPLRFCYDSPVQWLIVIATWVAVWMFAGATIQEVLRVSW